MLLSREDAQLFFKLHRALMFFVNQRLKVLDETFASPDQFSGASPQQRIKVRNALVAHPELIDAFAQENPARFSEAELSIVRSWRDFVADKFAIIRYLKNYAVFLNDRAPPIAFGVRPLTDPFPVLVGDHLPAVVDAVLLPFKGMIVYDGLLIGYRVVLGAGMRRELNERYRDAKARYGIVTSLPVPAVPAAPVQKRPPRQRQKSRDEVRKTLDAILEMIDRFCAEHLNEEYAEACRELAKVLSRKRPSPLLNGNPAAWASGIVRTIGWVNFLNDKSQKPYMRLGDIDVHFGVGESTGAARAATIRKLLKLMPLDPRWTLPSLVDDNPLIWILSVNGMLMDIRTAPREAQEIAFQKGLIPYIPGD